MVRYGGPRFEFFFTHQFLNNEEAIRKEDAQRVAFILRRREQQKAAQAECEAKKRREEEEQQRAAVEAEEARREAERQLESKRRHRSEKQRRLKELSTPVVHGGPLYCRGTYGRVIYPSARGVPLPQGRAGAAYMPGVDRHRIVPPPPAADAHPPWMSSGTAWMLERAEEKEEKRYLFAPSKRDPETLRETKQTIDAIERHHTSQFKKDGAGAQEESAAADALQIPAVGVDVPPKSKRPPSVFSHASSNEPIRALGTQHMETISKKKDVQNHLSRYGGILSPPRPAARPPTPFENMKASELTVRLVRMQQRLGR
ncbi:hypothetical protein C3747_11g67 [Trypanosoma cruzi]|uniref:Uncharacterized protein n=2 Tax=Trypanosoma cruzi TaxID=5693 RepID=Q4CQP0_TRYCC|nr:hypothetical protein, conserved [Trypanosoma cruzi]EAN82592.1 hypothetical protein, conserved [Trypanosoma cruzi]PWV18963.1 hypothetical protein C3747_11g67 [Trypanosoma cruzi]RNC59441.1 hypothetical protein TcCL_ESM02887 [Trypanosoma cruzi]|eukprot:XP_804443.1 hypothetical protein [Trypanosoma cruzi strain CL Brener]